MFERKSLLHFLEEKKLVWVFSRKETGLSFLEEKILV